MSVRATIRAIEGGALDEAIRAYCADRSVMSAYAKLELALAELARSLDEEAGDSLFLACLSTVSCRVAELGL